MAVLDEVTGFLAGQLGLTLGADLFAQYLPDAPDLAMVIYEYAGEAPSWTHDGLGIAYERPRIQVVARGNIEDYQSARTMAANAFQALVQVKNLVLAGVRYVVVEPLQSPFESHRDQKARPHVACNYRIEKVVS